MTRALSVRLCLHLGFRPYRGATAGDRLTLSRFFTGATVLPNNTVVITGISLDDEPNTYQCTFTDVAGRVTTSNGGQDGQRVLDDSTITCGTMPNGMAIRVIPWGPSDDSNEPMIQAVVGLRRRDSTGNWQPVTYVHDGTLAQRSVAVNACSDGVRNGDETDVDCGGDYCGVYGSFDVMFRPFLALFPALRHPTRTVQYAIMYTFKLGA